MPERKPVIPEGSAPNPALSAGMIVGDLLFVSGHVATDSSGTVVGVGDAEAQTRQIMDNIRGVVTAAGGNMEDVAKITCFITDIAYYPGYSKVRAETWPKDPPASSTVVVAGLVRPEFSSRSGSHRPSPRLNNRRNNRVYIGELTKTPFKVTMREGSFYF